MSTKDLIKRWKLSAPQSYKEYLEDTQNHLYPISQFFATCDDNTLRVNKVWWVSKACDVSTAICSAAIAVSLKDSIKSGRFYVPYLDISGFDKTLMLLASATIVGSYFIKHYSNSVIYTRTECRSVWAPKWYNIFSRSHMDVYRHMRQ